MRVNLAKKFEELQKIQELVKNARKLVEKELGRKVLDAFLEGKSQYEIYRLIEHIVRDIYGYDKIYRMQKERTEKARQSLKARKEHQEENHEGVENDG